MEGPQRSTDTAGGRRRLPEAAIALPGNETGGDFLQPLWEAFESGAGGRAVTYADLFERVDVVDPARLADLGWSSRDPADAPERTVTEHLEGDRTGRHPGPDREADRRVIDGGVGRSDTVNRTSRRTVTAAPRWGSDGIGT